MLDRERRDRGRMSGGRRLGGAHARLLARGGAERSRHLVAGERSLIGPVHGSLLRVPTGCGEGWGGRGGAERDARRPGPRGIGPPRSVLLGTVRPDRRRQLTVA